MFSVPVAYHTIPGSACEKILSPGASVTVTHRGNLGRFAVKTYALGPLKYPRRALGRLDAVDALKKTKQNKSPILK